MKCDLGMMIDNDVPAKRYGNKVGMSSYILDLSHTNKKEYRNINYFIVR